MGTDLNGDSGVRRDDSFEVEQTGGGSATWLDRRIVAMVLAVKAVLLLFVVQSYRIVSNTPLPSFYSWLEIWNRWDAQHYQRIAQFGYPASGENNFLIVFFPLYPLLVRLCAFIFQDYLLSAFVVSGLATLAAGLLLHKLVAIDDGDALARRAVWFMFVFPTSYFLHIGYTESLFLALALGSFVAARRERWWLVGVLGASACLTRISGLVLIPAFAVEVWQQYKVTKRVNRQWLWIGLLLLGVVAYPLLNKYVTGDAFAFITIQKEKFGRQIMPPWVGLKGVYGFLWNARTWQRQMNGVQELTFILLGFVCTVFAWCCLRASYAVWMTGNWLLFTSTSFILSVPRYTLVMFPIYILFAKLAARRDWAYAALTIWSLLYLSLFATLFTWGRWAF